MKTLTLLLTTLLSLTGFSQHMHSAYEGEDKRTVKALSEADIDGYLNGKGMGLAKAAELNGYPGPMHVLDAKKELELTEKQINQIQNIYDDMKKNAVSLGKQIVEKETALDEAFKTKTMSGKKLNGLTAEIAELQGKLRAIHLSAHLKTTEVLSKDQIKKYNELRGYSKETAAVYTCPMHSDVKSDKPGSCPKCGMDLIKK